MISVFWLDAKAQRSRKREQNEIGIEIKLIVKIIEFSISDILLTFEIKKGKEKEKNLNTLTI